jgi:hypothetical protein
MKVLVFTLLTLGTSFSWAGSGPLLLGAMLGDPTGLSGKYDLSSDTAVDGGLAYTLGGRSGAQVHGDYLKGYPRAIVAGEADLNFYYGIGVRIVTLNSGNDSGRLSVGPRLPVSLSYELKNPDIEFFGEFAFILDLAPSVAPDVDLAVGIRYRF